MNVVSFYRFLDLLDPASLQVRLQSVCEQHGLLGTILLAEEGFNGTLAGSGEAVQAVFDFLRQELSLATPIDARWTSTDEAPFRRMRVKQKKEIVTLGRAEIAPHNATGKHVSPEEWNHLIARPETLLIDTRNHYEIEVGTFPGSVDPGTDSFREFPAFAEALARSGDSPQYFIFDFCGTRP